MYPRHRFHVVADVPDRLADLDLLARNYRWVWDRRAQALFDRIDVAPAASSWRKCGVHPVRLLERTTTARWEELAGDDRFVAEVAQTADALRASLGGPSWFEGRQSPLELVAYFSPEFGITDALPQYSGGLGVLAGDHLKAASDLGVPLVAVGLLYTEGYFHQELSAEGRQHEHNERIDPAGVAIEPTGVDVTVDLAGVPAVVRVWRAEVGRITLLLLDTNVPPNPPEVAMVTDRLYGGDQQHRLRQEIVLGIGGVRALRALGLHPGVFHSNEGHAGFLGLERVREWIGRGLAFDEAVEAVRAGGVFTTHTPVPAGIDRFPRELFEPYFTDFATSCGVDFEELWALGRGDEPDDEFNMAVMGLRLAARRNGVARLHGEVSRRMFGGLWPDLPSANTPIGHITNGVHARSWVSDPVDALLTETIGEEWHLADAASWERVHGLDPATIWATKNAGRRELVAEVRDRLGADLLDPDVLTIGFARRFATYKRATLLLQYPDRLRALLRDPERPVQFVFAGKAHPADHPGKELIRQIHSFAQEADVRHRFVFLPDYDIGIARTMYHGCDVWLNTPQRPMEACGTSGMKAALNGGLNLSIRDGWWDEMSTGDNGWDIPSFDDPDPARRDRREATAALDLIEGHLVPEFYARDADGVPTGWARRIATDWSTLGWNVTAGRMVREYVTELYEPAAAAGAIAAADDGAAARELTAWIRGVTRAWPSVTIELDAGRSDLDDGRQERARTVVAAVEPGDLRADELDVQLVHGPLDDDGEFVDAELRVVVMTPDEIDGDAAAPAGPLRYRAEFTTGAAGPWGATVRVLPVHPGLGSVYETGFVASA